MVGGPIAFLDISSGSRGLSLKRHPRPVDNDPQSQSHGVKGNPVARRGRKVTGLRRWLKPKLAGLPPGPVGPRGLPRSWHRNQTQGGRVNAAEAPRAYSE